MSYPLRVVSPSERLDRIEFNPRAEVMDHVIHLGAYTCPHCAVERDLTTSTFRRHQHLRVSTLSADWAARLDEARPIIPLRWESFLDFHCAGCGAPVRIIYEPGHEIAMGAHTFRVVAVVETVQERTV